MVQNVCTYKVEIKLSKDYKYFEITNLKPKDDVKYILESDPSAIKKKLEDVKNDERYEQVYEEDRSSASC